MPPRPSPTSDSRMFEELVFFLVAIFLIWLLIQRIDQTGLESFWLEVAAYFAVHLLPIIKVLAALVVVSAIIGGAYSLYHLHLISAEEQKIYGPSKASAAEAAEAARPVNERWQGVLAHIDSVNPSDWRLAIIDADVMLDELLRVQGYLGDSIGEMLKAVDKSDFLTLDAAWDAHKVRNQIAHSGADFQLDSREAKRVVAEYEAVFKEFQII